MTTATAARPAKETRTFKMHAKLLMDVIQRQAGDLSKAGLEGVMNSVDAGAANCEITIEPDRLVVADDGPGIADRETLLQVFEVFGQPHAAGENKVYGTFRMGRGQLFTFGRNVWRTGRFRMTVDVKHAGLDYELEELDEEFPGCSITVDLYDRLRPTDLHRTEEELTRWCRYAQTRVTINGVGASTDPAAEKWDHATPEAYVRFNDNASLQVFNLGVHAMDLSKYHYGVGGVIVSRQQLKVNFARNAVLADCPVWKKVKRLVDAASTSRNLKDARLDDAGRARLVQQFVQGDLTYREFAGAKLLRAVDNRLYSLSQLKRKVRDYHRPTPLLARPAGDLKGLRLLKSGLAVVLAEPSFRLFKRTLPKLVDFLNKAHRSQPGCDTAKDPWAAGDFDEMTAQLSGDFDAVDEAEVRPREKVWRDLASTAGWVVSNAALDELRAARLLRAGAGYGREEATLEEIEEAQEVAAASEGFRRARKVLVGLSDVADYWTDGATFVALNRKFLEKLDFDVNGLFAVDEAVLRETCFETPTGPDRVADSEYYDRLSDRLHLLGPMVTKMRIGLPTVLKRHKLRPGAAVLKELDRDENNGTPLPAVSDGEFPDGEFPDGE